MDKTEEEIVVLKQEATKQVLAQFQRFKATGKLPIGVDPVSRPPPLPADATHGMKEAHRWFELDVLRAILLDVLGVQGRVWRYEMVMSQSSDGAGVRLILDYCGNRDVNVVDIASKRLWTGAKK